MRIIGINDSKKPDSAPREQLAMEIKAKAAAWSVTFVEVEEIDTINIYWAGAPCNATGGPRAASDAAASLYGIPPPVSVLLLP